MAGYITGVKQTNPTRNTNMMTTFYIVASLTALVVIVVLNQKYNR